MQSDIRTGIVSKATTERRKRYDMKSVAELIVFDQVKFAIGVICI